MHEISPQPQARRARLQLVDDISDFPWARSPGPRMVRVLDARPELRAGLSSADALAATHHAVAPIVELPIGEWDPQATPTLSGALGALVLDGVILRLVRVGNREAAELIGPGELIRPLDAEDGREAPVPYETTWCVVQEVQIAVLDARFAQVAGRWPSILDAVFSRMAGRARSSTVLLAIAQLGGLDLRLLALLWHIADRFGRVDMDGVVIPIRLTHEVLARLAGAQRPSVTTALSRLKRAGLVHRRGGGWWVLQGSPPEEVAELHAEGGRLLATLS